jgi:hypothetical protein
MEWLHPREPWWVKVAVSVWVLIVLWWILQEVFS